MNGIKDIAISRNADTQYGKINMTTQQKAPNKYLMNVKMGPMTVQKMVYDGAKAKSSGMQGKKDITGEELDELKEEAVINQEMQYEKLGYKLAIKGVEPINGSDAYAIELTDPRGKKSTEWYDVASGYKVRSVKTSKTEQGEITTQTDFSDYKDYNGVKFPATINANFGPMR
ncbi:MAG: hypothetical protein IPH89_06555 [Bacteroidetes bacterium]|nr:hypothetical protein [Bacteroidota bacterium]